MTICRVSFLGSPLFQVGKGERSQQPFPELKDGQPRKDGRYPGPLRGRHPFSMDQHRAQQPRDGHQE